MNKILVMHFVSGLLSGGVEQVIYNYGTFMNRDRYEFIIVYQHEAKKESLSKIESIPCRAVRITARNENFIKNIIDSYTIIKKYNPDIVHAHMNLMNFCALLPARLLGIKVRICHSHIAEVNFNKIYRFAASIFKLLNIITATNLMTCGKEAGIYMYGKNLMNSGKVKLLENAIDLEQFKRKAELRIKIRNKLQCDDNTFLIGNIGRFSKQKNQKRLLDIFSEIYKMDTNTKLLLVGDGELINDCKKRAQELSLSNAVVFYGITNKVNEIYSAIDVFVLPSLYEGLPVVAIEVQAARLPAVFSDTVAKSSKLSEYIEFLSLNESNAEWAKVILSKKNFDRTVDINELQLRYDIKRNAKQLEDYYLSALD